MELDAGAVVEQDRQVQEPVDLLLAGRLIARGEVVVVDGNYGLRVLEIVPRRRADKQPERQRLSSLRLRSRACLLALCDIVMRLEDTRWECVPDFWQSW
jgi:hypothetical protein